METKDFTALIGIFIVALVAAGLAWAGSQGSVDAFGTPLFALGVALAFIIQWIAFIPAYLLQTEKFFDITGSLTYITIGLAAFYLNGSNDLRTCLLVGMILIWAGRLGAFLFSRILKSGKDSRFDKIKKSPTHFLQTWTLQGLWISFTLAAALAAITARVKVEMDVLAWLGLLVWVFGFGIEAIADWQKSQFRKNPENKEKFISGGLWAWSRHPNYFGEITLWTGVAITALPVLRGWQLLTLVSPVFIFLLLTRISGIPLLEKKADQKWGGQADYETYKGNTSVLVPLPPRKQ